ncbi:helix-turn-helix domain-containing protein [Pseudomonas sp. LS44]|uniref:helix-turn-helix domain-containing protein n=1 Tax=Pseudomonas sp. LS44 TaxID=1357074 RepID=UPI00215B0FB1|nr:helix-turn-helix domain-containing protein [Pseudomonas sp. LS44]UVE17448.1 helix-turn-helix domain-containing protein [Pseudomonas sp. LS44]
MIAVLETLAGEPESLSASEIARRLQLSTSTLSLILKTLHETGYVERLPDRSFRLGAGVLRLLQGVRQRYPLLGVANDVLGRLAEQCRCGCALAQVTSGRQEVVLTVGNTGELGISPGVQLPMDPPHGTLAMAWRTPKEVSVWLQQAEKSGAVVDTKVQLELLEHVRGLGYAVYGMRSNGSAMMAQFRDLLSAVQHAGSMEVLRRQLDKMALAVDAHLYTPQELDDSQSKSVSHIIAPVFGVDGQPHYLVSLHPMQDLVSASSLRQYVEELQHAAHALTSEIGGKIGTC